MVEFAGWEMPVQYAGVVEEHRAVRSRAGLFDVSHMGEIRVFGPEAEVLLQRLTPNDVSRLVPGRAHYSGLLTEEGTYVDDLLVYRLGEEEFLLVVNAANAEADLAWMEEHREGRAEVEDRSDDYALLALQGPEAEAILQPLTPLALEEIRYYRFATGDVGGTRALVSRTGYTGEDGFELYVSPEDAPGLWDALLDEGASRGLVPAGLGARDTLRLEAGMALYGHEIDRETTPLEAGLDWVVKLDKGDFIGRDALERQRREGPEKKLAGFRVTGRGIARQGHELVGAGEGEVVGRVTSGTWSPTFEEAIGMAHLPPELAEAGSRVAIRVRSREVEAEVVELPFYRRSC